MSLSGSEPIKTKPVIDPNDEFPISAEVYCKLKHPNALQSRIFRKAMTVEARYKKFFIKDWDQKYKEFFSRKV